MAQRLTGVVALFLILLIFAPWLYQLNPPLPDVSALHLDVPAKPSPPQEVKQSPNIVAELPADAVYSLIDGESGAEAPAQNTASSKSDAAVLASVRRENQRSADSAGPESIDESTGKRYRVRAGVFRNPSRAMLRLNTAGYVVKRELYRESDKGPLYALYVGGALDEQGAADMVRSLKQRFDIKARTEEVQTMSVTVVDILLYGGVFLLAAWFTWYGFLEQVMTLFTLAVAVWAGVYFATQVGDLFAFYFNAEWLRELIGGVLIFFLVLVVGFWLARLLVAMARLGRLLWLNRLLSMLTSILFAFASVWVILSVTLLLPIQPPLNERDWWRDSAAISFVMERGTRISALINTGVETAIQNEGDRTGAATPASSNNTETSIAPSNTTPTNTRTP